LTLPESVQKKFAKGFPKNWAKVIQTYHDETHKVSTLKQTSRVIKERVIIKSRILRTTTVIANGEQQEVDSDDDLGELF
jgi:hypothetical protein